MTSKRIVKAHPNEAIQAIVADAAPSAGAKAARRSTIHPLLSQSNTCTRSREVSTACGTPWKYLTRCHQCIPRSVGKSCRKSVVRICRLSICSGLVVTILSQLTGACSKSSSIGKCSKRRRLSIKPSIQCSL